MKEALRAATIARVMRIAVSIVLKKMSPYKRFSEQAKNEEMLLILEQAFFDASSYKSHGRKKRKGDRPQTALR